LRDLVVVASDLLFEPLTMQLSPDTLVCPADSLLIGVLQATGSGQLTYLWNTGDTTALIYAGPIETTTTYTVTLVDERGCSIAGAITVTAGRPVQASADPAGLIAPGQSVLLEASEDPLWVSYTWAPDSSLSSTIGRVVVANPFENITYCVVAVDTLGCPSEDCVDIPVDLLVNMPNAFTPNGDGLNDVFRVPISVPCEELLLFQVFNRWGEQVFSSALFGIGWDGTYRGKPQESGVYIYRVELLCGELQQRKSFTGTVTLLY
jgi:gliding motility-associated-like protein